MGNQTGFPILKIIWGALFFSQIILNFVAAIMVGPISTEFLLNTSNLFVFYFFGIICFIASMLLPRFLIRTAKTRINQNETEKQNLNRAIAECDLQVMTQYYITPYILKLALTESISIMGLASSIQTQFNNMLPFTILAIIGFLMAFPADKKIQETFINLETQ